MKAQASLNKRDLAVASLEAAGWERYCTYPEAKNRLVYRIRSKRSGYLYEYKTISCKGRTLTGCVAPR